ARPGLLHAEPAKLVEERGRRPLLRPLSKPRLDRDEADQWTPNCSAAGRSWRLKIVQGGGRRAGITGPSWSAGRVLASRARAHIYFSMGSMWSPLWYSEDYLRFREVHV